MNLFDEYGEDELLLIPVKNLGLRRDPWTFSRGVKIDRKFFDENDELRVCVEVAYTYEDENREAYPSSRTIKWFKIDGTVGLERTDTLTYSVKDIKHEKRKVRQGRIDYMVAAGENLAELAAAMPEPFKTSYTQAAQSVDTILNHYELEITHYISKGNREFEDAVKNETDPAILTMLDLMVRPPDAEFSAGLNIRQTILHQLTGEYNP